MHLPKELRLMFYERLPRHIVLTLVDMPASAFDTAPTLILLSRTCSIQLLRVSRAVYVEARELVWQQAEQWILCSPARVLGSRDVGPEVLSNFLLWIVRAQDYLVRDYHHMQLCHGVASSE
jgi:hypothetical protein